MPRVNVQGFGQVNFPDDMSEADITRAIETDILPKVNRGEAPPQPAAKERTWGEALSDTGVQLAEGVNTIAGAVPNLVAPEGKTAQFFNENAQHWRDKQSDPLKAKIAAADEAITAAGEDGVMAQIAEAAGQYFSDPALAARFVVTNLPSMIPGIGAAKLAQAAALARGATAAKAATAATTAAGATNAALNAGGARGEAFEDIKNTLIRRGMSPEEAEQMALSDSRVAAAVGAVAGYVSGKTGLEKSLVGGAGAKGAVRAGAGATAAELAGEQIEEVAPKLATNAQASEYDGRSLGKDVGRTIVETAIGSGPGAVVAGGATASNTLTEERAAAEAAAKKAAEEQAAAEAAAKEQPKQLLLPAPKIEVDSSGAASVVGDNWQQRVEAIYADDSLTPVERSDKVAQLFKLGPQEADVETPEPAKADALKALPNPGKDAGDTPTTTKFVDTEGNAQDFIGQRAQQFEQAISGLTPSQQIEARAAFYGLASQKVEPEPVKPEAPKALPTPEGSTPHPASVDSRGVVQTHVGQQDQALAEIERNDKLTPSQKNEQRATVLGMAPQATDEARMRQLAEESNKRKAARKQPGIDTRADGVEPTQQAGVYRRATEDGKIEYAMPNVPGASMVVSDHPTIQGRVIESMTVPTSIKGKSAETVQQLLMQAAMQDRPLVRRSGKKFEFERGLLDRAAGALKGRVRGNASLVGAGKTAGSVEAEVAAYKERLRKAAEERAKAAEQPQDEGLSEEEQQAAQDELEQEQQHVVDEPDQQAEQPDESRQEAPEPKPEMDEPTRLGRGLLRALAAKDITREQYNDAKAALEDGDLDTARGLLDATSVPDAVHEKKQKPEDIKKMIRDIVDEAFESRAAVEKDSQLSKKDDSLPRAGAVEVAPNPDDKQATKEFAALPIAQRERVTQKVATAILPRLLSELGLAGRYVMGFTAGGYLGRTNPSISLTFDADVSWDVAAEAMAAAGALLNQQSVVVMDESVTEGEDVVSAVRIVPSRPMTAQESEALYDRIYAKTGGALDKEGTSPAGGFTAKDGSLLFLNFSGLSDAEFHNAIDGAIAGYKPGLDFTTDIGRMKSKLVPTDGKENEHVESDARAGQAAGRALAWRGHRWFDSLQAESNEVFARAVERERARPDGAGSGSHRESRAGAGDARRNYGQQGKEHAVSVTAVHYSREPRAVLDSSKYGSGLKGAERARLELWSADKSQQGRIYFYVDEGAGISPEAGVGSHPHALNLHGLYDWKADPLKLWEAARKEYPHNVADAINHVERAIMSLGFDGYYAPGSMGKQGAAVLLGKHQVSLDDGKESRAAPVSRREKLTALRERAEQMLGKDARIVTFLDQLFSLKDGSPISGQYARDLIMVAMNAADAMGTLNHETMHHAMSAYYTPAQQQLLRSAFKPGGKLADQVREALRKDGQHEVATDEGYLASDDEYVTFGFQYWKKGDVQFKGQVGQLLQMFADFLERVRNWINGAGFNTAEDLFKALDEGKLAGKRVDASPQLEALFAESRAPVKSGVLDGFVRGVIGKLGEAHASMDVPQVLKQLGVEELPLVVADRVVSDKVLFDHGIKQDQVRNLLGLLGNPLAILKSATVDGALVVVTDIADRQGRPVVVAIHPGAAVPGRETMRVNKIASIYGRNDHQRFFEREAKEGRVLYANEKSPEKLRVLGLRLPASGTSSQGSDAIIGNRATTVKESRAKPGKLADEVRAHKEKQSVKKASSWTERYLPAYHDKAKRIIDSIDHFLDPLGKLPSRDTYLMQRYKTLGAIARYEEIGKGIYDTLAKATKDDAKAIYDYLTTAGAKTDKIKDSALAKKAVEVKALIDKVGQALVKRGLIDEKTYLKHKDAYLPRLYLKHLLDESSAWRVGTGRKTSDQGYTKQRKDIPEDVRKVFLGEVEDPAFLSAVGVTRAMRDLFILHWLEQIGQNQQWVLPRSLVEWNGQRVSAHWLKKEAERLRQQAEHYDAETAKKALEQAGDMDRAADAALAEVSGDALKDYRQVPNSPRYGMMRGMWVRTEIYEDIVGLGDLTPENSNWLQSLFGYGGAGTKLTQLWKAGKVSLNPAAQIRNFVSNMVLLQLSGVPLHSIPKLFVGAAREIVNGGKHWDVAKKYGVTESSFSSQELFRMRNELLDLEERTKGLSSLGFIRKAGSWVMDRAGHAYELAEAIGKVMKITDAMERQGLSEEQAALDAQKWLFDYSLVPNAVRYARNAPIGAPFITFAYKVLPRMIEVSLHHPQRLLPWVGLFAALPMLAAASLGADGDDLEKWKQSLPEYMRNRSHLAMLPYRDAQGRIQVADLGFFFPWTMFVELARAGMRGDMQDTLRSVGAFGGPLPDLLTAVTTGKDRFTGRDIADPGDPPARRAGAILSYVWDMAVPPPISTKGPLAKLIDSEGGTTDKFGYQKVTTPQALAGGLGFTYRSFDPALTRAENIKRAVADVRKVEQRLKSKLTDQSLTDKQRDSLIREYVAEIERRNQLIQEYIEKTEPKRK